MQKKNELEKDTKAKGAAQELDMDALEDVAGGRVDCWETNVRGAIYRGYDVIDDKTGEVVGRFGGVNRRGQAIARSHANEFDKQHNHR